MLLWVETWLIAGYALPAIGAGDVGKELNYWDFIELYKEVLMDGRATNEGLEDPIWQRLAWC